MHDVVMCCYDVVCGCVTSVKVVGKKTDSACADGDYTTGSAFFCHGHPCPLSRSVSVEVSASLSAVRLEQGWAKHGEIFSSVKPWVAIVTRAKQATCCQGCFRPGACPDPDIGERTPRLAPSREFPLFVLFCGQQKFE